MNFKICHIGCGSISTRGHGPAIKKYSEEYPGTILAGCCDMDMIKANVFKDKYEFKTAYTDWNEMLEKEKPDAVSLVVPVNQTTVISIGIVGKGFNLITEKPPGMTKKDCGEIIDAINKSGVKASVAFNRRYMPLVKKLSALLDSEGKQKLNNIKYDFYRVGRKDRDFSTTAIHGIDTVKMLAGCDYSKLEIRYQPIEGTPAGNIFIQGKMSSGATVSINFYPDSGITAERAVINSSSNTYFINMPIWDCEDYPGKILYYKNGKLEKKIKGKETDMYISSGFYDEHADFYNAVRNGKSVQYEVSDSLQSVEIMECIRLKKDTYNNIDGIARIL